MSTLWQRLRKRAQPDEEGVFFTVLDVGTAVVKALVCQVRDEGARVVGVGRERQGAGAMQAGAITDIAAVVDACDQALRQAEDMTEQVLGQKVVPDQAVLGIAGELVKGAACTVRVQRPKPTERITAGELATVVERVERLALNQVREEMAWERRTPAVEIRLVNAAIVGVEIDGYRVVNPLRFQGGNLAVTAFNAFAPLVHVGALRTVATELGLEPLAIIAEPFAVARALTPGEAIFIDVGGGTTDLALARRGIEGTRSFALGGQTFTGRIASTMGLSPERAEETKLAYARRRLDADLSERVRQAIAGERQTWLDSVELLLEELAGGDPLPARLCLCGGGSGLPDIVEGLRSFPWLRRLPFPRYPEISLSQPRDVAGIQDSTHQLLSPQDVTPLALAAQALRQQERPLGLLDLALERALRAMKV